MPLVKAAVCRYKLWLSVIVFAFVFFLSGCALINNWLQNPGQESQEEAVVSISKITLPEANPENILKTSEGSEVLSDIVAVVFKEGVRPEVRLRVADKVGGTLAGDIPQIDVAYIKFPRPKTEAELRNIVQTLDAEPAVRSASLEHIIVLDSSIPQETDNEVLPEDKNWSFERIQLSQALGVLAAQNINLSDDIIVAVIDNGFDLTHPDLERNFVRVLPGGYVPIDFGNRDTDVSPDKVAGLVASKHGTAVAGIIAATINGQGMNGIAPTAKIFPIKYTGSKWCELRPAGYKCSAMASYSVAAGVVYATNAGVAIINLSLGKDQPNCDPEMRWDVSRAIRYAAENGVLIVGAAGNDDKPATNHWPSCLEEVVAVGATDRNDDRAQTFQWGSNYPENEDDEASLALAAPGVDVYTTRPSSRLLGLYGNFLGTSAATPFVSGLAALLKQIEPSLSPQQIKEILRITADPIWVDTPVDPQTWRRINAYKAVKSLLEPNIAHLDVDIEPKPVPFNTSSQGSPAWNYHVTIRETKGIGVDLNGIRFEYFDINGELAWDITTPAKFFSRTFGTTRVPPGGTIETRLHQNPGSTHDYISNEWTIYATDDNGNAIIAPATIYFQNNATRGLTIQFNPSPAPFTGQGWQTEMTISETEGVNVELTRFNCGYYDQDEVPLRDASFTVGREFFDNTFGTTTVPAGAALSGFISLSFKPQAAEVSCVAIGIDANGHPVYGANSLELGGLQGQSTPSGPQVNPSVPLPQTTDLTW